MKNRKHSKTKSSIKSEKLKRILRTPGGPRKVRNAFFSKLLPKEIRNNVTNVSGHPYFSQIIELTRSKHFERAYNFYFQKFDAKLAINWITGLLLHHKDIIKKFLLIQEELTVNILSDNFDQACINLDEVDDTLGLSLWSISLRSSILKIAEKYEELHLFSSDVISKCKDNSFLKAVVSNMLERYDDSSMFLSSTSAFKKQVLRTCQDELRDFLLYRVIPFEHPKNEHINYENVFYFEKCSSIIDIYKFFIDYISYCVKNTDDSICFDIYDIGITIKNNFADVLFEGLFSNFGLHPNFNGRTTHYDYVDLYSCGRYDEVCNIAKINAGSFVDFATFEIISKAFARTLDNPYDGIKARLLEDLSKIYIKNEGFNKSRLNLLSMCHAFSGIPWFRELQFLISRETGSQKDTQDYLLCLSSVYARSFYPRKIVGLGSEFQTEYLEYCKTKWPNSISIQLLESLRSNDTLGFQRSFKGRLDENRYNKYYAKLLISSGEIDEGVKVLSDMIRCTDPIIINEAVKILADALIESERFIEVINLFVNFSLDNSNAIFLFDTERICNAAKQLVNKEKTIDIPIALSLHSRFINDKFDSTLRYSFDSFLRNNGVIDPLDLLLAAENICAKKINYFLEHVCIHETMKLSLNFDTKKDIENCRVRICNYLIGKNISKDSLVKEIKEINREQVVRRARNQVDQSRIQSDTSVFRDARSQPFEEAFSRYCKLATQDFSTYDDERILSNLFYSIPRQILEESSHIVHVIDLSLNEKNDTFHRLVKLLKSEFTFGDRGLNYYLSTRIRHGVLPETLRSCVSNENLITTVDPNTGKPKENKYWADHLYFSNQIERSLIVENLNQFTLSFESLIYEINERWLQIVSLDEELSKMQSGGQKEKALFNYSTSSLETYALQKKITDNEYDTFIKVIVDWLWERTEANLKKVKAKILGDAKINFQTCVNKLDQQVNNILSNQEDRTRINDAINRARESLDLSLNKIATWFTRSDVDNLKDFDLSTPIEIASRSVGVEIMRDATSDDLSFNGKHLTNFVDIFYILFENAATKSQVPKSELNISIVYKLKENGCYQIQIKNNCQYINNTERYEKNLEYYREKYLDDDLVSKKSQSEGGTGIFKISRILSKDLEVDFELVFGYVNNDSFEMKIIIFNPSKLLYNENTNS